MLLGSLEAGGTKMVCAVGNEKGGILHKRTIQTKTPAETIPDILNFFTDTGIEALGIGSFGPVELDRKSPFYGCITSSPKTAWRNVNILNAFKESLNIPIGLDTDVNAAALGEATWGCTKGMDTSMYITVGTGVGVGIYIDGKTYHGMQHSEAGHFIVSRYPNDAVQSCCPYHQNCLEGLASGPAIQKRWGLKAEELYKRKEVWDLEAYYLGQAISNYILLLSPQRIVLGGGVMHQKRLYDLVHKEVKKNLAGYIKGKQLDDLEKYIVPPSLNDNQGVMGGLQLAYLEIKDQS